MTLPREVIIDLLPAYLSGEASEATRALVEEHLKQDPELANRVRAAASAPIPKLAPTLPTELELQALHRTRKLLGIQRWLFALAITFTALALATRISFTHGHIRTVTLLLFEYPLPFGTCLAVATTFWIAYFLMRRSMRPHWS